MSAHSSVGVRVLPVSGASRAFPAEGVVTREGAEGTFDPQQ